GVVGGDTQDVGEDVEPLARSNEHFTQVFTRVLPLQRSEIKDERLRDPGVVDVVRGDHQKSLHIGGRREVEWKEGLTALIAQSVGDTLSLLLVIHHDLALDGARRRNSEIVVEQRTKDWILDGRERLLGAHHPSEEALPECLWSNWSFGSSWLCGSKQG